MNFFIYYAVGFMTSGYIMLLVFDERIYYDVGFWSSCAYWRQHWISGVKMCAISMKVPQEKLSFRSMTFLTMCFRYIKQSMQERLSS